MKKAIAVMLSLLILSAASVAQNKPAAPADPAVAGKEASAVKSAPDSTVAAVKHDAPPVKRTSDSTVVAVKHEAPAVKPAPDSTVAAVTREAPPVGNAPDSTSAVGESGPSAASVDPAPDSTAAAPEPAAAEEEAKSYRLAVHFEANSLELTPLSARLLDSMSALFVHSRRNRYEVHGYTCPVAAGGKKVTRLSAQRVETIVDYLMDIGVPGENIVTIVNAPKSAAKGECADDRQVDIVSAGARWREQEPAAKPEPPKPEPPKPEPPKAVEPEPSEPEPAEPEPVKTAEPEPPAAEPAKPDAGKQIVAVYMAGQEPQNAKGVHSIMGGELARVMSESDKYTAVDRTEAILEQLDREHVYQRSGAVDDDQIKTIGHQLGVQYLCISNINPVGKRYYLDTRFVDIVTAEIKRSVTATSTLKDADEMARVGRNIALELLEAEKTRQQRLLRKRIYRYTAIGLNVLGAGALAYGYFENGNVVKYTAEHEGTRKGDDGKPRPVTYLEDGPEAERAAVRRNAAYIAGWGLLAAGITIHILF